MLMIRRDIAINDIYATRFNNRVCCYFCRLCCLRRVYARFTYVAVVCHACAMPFERCRRRATPEMPRLFAAARLMLSLSLFAPPRERSHAAMSPGCRVSRRAAASRSAARAQQPRVRKRDVAVASFDDMPRFRRPAALSEKMRGVMLSQRCARSAMLIQTDVVKRA